MQLVFYLITFSTPCMGYLLYLMFRYDRKCDGCDGKFGNLVGTKHTPGPAVTGTEYPYQVIRCGPEGSFREQLN